MFVIFATLCFNIGLLKWQIELSFFMVFFVTFVMRNRKKDLSESVATVACVFGAIIYANALLPGWDDARYGYSINVPGAIDLLLFLGYLIASVKKGSTNIPKIGANNE